MRQYNRGANYDDRGYSRIIRREPAYRDRGWWGSCSIVNRGQDIVWFLVGIIEILLVLRFVFELFGARLAVFTDLVYALSNPFVVPFQGIFKSITTGPGILDISAIVAMIVFSFIGWGIAALISLVLSPQGNRC